MLKPLGGNCAVLPKVCFYYNGGILFHQALLFAFACSLAGGFPGTLVQNLLVFGVEIQAVLGATLFQLGNADSFGFFLLLGAFLLLHDALGDVLNAQRLTFGSILKKKANSTKNSTPCAIMAP